MPSAPGRPALAGLQVERRCRRQPKGELRIARSDGCRLVENLPNDLAGVRGAVGIGIGIDAIEQLSVALVLDRIDCLQDRVDIGDDAS